MNKILRRSAAASLSCLLLLATLATVSCRRNPASEGIPHKDDYQQAYIYAYPMIAAYKVMYETNIDKTSARYKGPFNQVLNDVGLVTPKNTAVPAPNTDTLDSVLEADLRAEPLVFCVPEIERNRYFVVQLTDMYTFNYGYAGTRTTGNDAGCYMVAGPSWKGTTPPGIRKLFQSETQFSRLIYRTQIFSPADLPNVKKIQAGYTVQPLSAYVHQPAPPVSPLDFPQPTDDALKTAFPKYLNFLLQFCPQVAEEAAVRLQFAAIGIGPGTPFDFAKLSVSQKAELTQAVKDGYAAIQDRQNNLGRDFNGWRVASPYGNRDTFHGDFLRRAASAMYGLFGNDADEGVNPTTKSDGIGSPLDGSKHNYTLTFSPSKVPPVSAFWSVSIYEGKSQSLVDNPINRYAVSSPMLSGLKKTEDATVTIYIQKDPPDGDKKATWLPAPNGPIYLVMRLYWPTKPAIVNDRQVPSILPVPAGTWSPPGVLIAR